MVSAALLHSLRKVGDLPRVPEALGYAPAWDELPSGALLPAEKLVVIGRQGEFAWYGAAGNHALVRRAARALAGRGIPGVIAGIDAGARELAVAAESGRPLTVSLDAPDPVALARLGRLAMLPGEQPLATVCRIRDALDGRAVDQRFFAGFRRALDAVMGSFPGRIPNADRHGLGLLLLTRILFLYFIEAKGWLGGRPRFIREEVDRCLGARRRRCRTRFCRQGSARCSASS